MTNRLEIKNLTFERNDMPIFENVSAQWQSGDVIQLAGSNGSGKTSLLRCIAGLAHTSSGDIRWNTHRVDSVHFRSCLLYLGHQVAVNESLSVIENLRWYFALNGPKYDALNLCDGEQASSKQRTEQQVVSVSEQDLNMALEQVGLHRYRDIPCYQLSAGQKRRVALARLYCSQASIWLLDEPFTAIDKKGVSELEQRIEQHAEQGGLVVLTTHQAWRSTRIQVLDMEHYQAAPASFTDTLDART